VVQWGCAGVCRGLRGGSWVGLPAGQPLGSACPVDRVHPLGAVASSVGRLDVLPCSGGLVWGTPPSPGPRPDRAPYRAGVVSAGCPLGRLVRPASAFRVGALFHRPAGHPVLGRPCVGHPRLALWPGAVPCRCPVCRVPLGRPVRPAGASRGGALFYRPVGHPRCSGDRPPNAPALHSDRVPYRVGVLSTGSPWAGPSARSAPLASASSFIGPPKTLALGRPPAEHPRLAP